jgi:hypothetical protein
MWRSLLPAALLLVLLPAKGPAHHAFAAEFEVSKKITVTGTVTKMVWLNPHARFFMDVKEPRGVVQWEILLGSPNLLLRQGLSKTFVKPGEKVTITGYKARDGKHLASARTVKLPSGQVANFGSEGDGGPE